MLFYLRPSRLFYGWWIVGAAFLIALYVGGVVFYGFTAIFEPISDELGWSYTQISLAASLRGLEVSLLAPIVGILVDRWGPRRIIFGGAVFIALGLILLSRSMSLGMFYGAFALVAIGISGCTMTALMTTVANWFRKKLGLASGIAFCGFGFGGLLVPLVVKLIDVYGWRMAMVLLALGMLVLVLPLSFLFRHKPEQYGYLPDGQIEGPATLNSVSSPPSAVEVNIPVRQVLKSRPFWCLALAFTCHTMVISAVVAHVMPYLSSIGIARSVSSLIATAVPLTSVSGRLVLGWLGDRVNKKLIAAGAFAIMSIGSLCFGYAGTAGIWLLVPFIILFGIGYGGINTLKIALQGEYFGRTSFGTVLGVMVGITMSGSILGPPLAGWVYDNWGSYQGIWFIFAGLAVVALLSILALRPVRTTVAPADKA
ncbi:MFS transporter [Chloroflexota bacterium]